TDIGIIALERESSRNYKRDSRPFLDYRVFARFYAKALGAKLIYADSMIRSETYNKLENGEAYEYNKASFRPLFPAQTEVFIANNKTGKSVRAIEAGTIAFLKENREAGKRQFILSPRRGLAPRTICRNCGKGLLCENCGGALVLHGAKRQKPDDVTVYVCHRCGDAADSMIRCRHCESWDLIPFRIGTEQIEIELKELFPKQDIIRFDRDTIKTETDAVKAMRKFEVPGSILIGTEISFSYLAEKIDAVLVIFPELLTSVPEYTGDENALRFILRAKSLASIKFAIQTAEPELPIIKWSENANLADFYRREIELRKSLRYPPFGTLVLITYAKNAAIQKQIEESFAAYQPTFFEGMGDSKEERVFFRMENKNWPDAKFRELCLSLPQNCAVEVMPERLFS
ncbi:MAG: hypothetical protein HYV68_01680, partial [Candidatus Taylorbacteria bacterium]|nr:hypothetical protein [Candidatus Taylorbacteria bacterium]